MLNVTKEVNVKRIITRLLLVALVIIIAFQLTGCDKIADMLKGNEVAEVDPDLKRETFLTVYEDMKKEAEAKASDGLLVGVVMQKRPDEPWDGKAAAWRAGFYSQEQKKVYFIVWSNGKAKLDKEEDPGEDISSRVITGPVSVDSVDALEIAKAIMITQIDPNAGDDFTGLALAYSNSLQRHVWAVDFAKEHRVLVDAVTGEVLDAK